MIAGADPPPESERTFADVLNALSAGNRGGFGRRARRPALHPVPEPVLPQLPVATPDTAHEPAADATDEAAIVRPYAWTRGRTRPAVDLGIETLVSAAGPLAASAPPEHRTIAELCRTPQSVAEVAALLAVPLGVAKVLIGDLATAGSLTVHGTGDQLTLMERVLSGLRRL